MEGLWQIIKIVFLFCFTLTCYFYVHQRLKTPLMVATTALCPVRQLSFRNMASFVHELLVREFTKFTTVRATRKISINDRIALEEKWREDLLVRAKFIGQNSGLDVTAQNPRCLVPPTLENMQIFFCL